MNQAHLHLMINHLPIMGVVIATLVLISGFIIKNKIVKRTALGIYILSCFGIIPSHITGEGAEEIAEKIPEISHDLIHTHE